MEGLSLKLLKIFWDVVGGEALTAINAFQSKDRWFRSLSATFITLIPKKGAVEIKDFRPISLIGCLYKLLSKTLALHLKTLVRKLISKSQNAFILVRQIMDCLLIANECIDARIQADKSRVVCKIDMEKAYDHINWFFRDTFVKRWVLEFVGEIGLRFVFPVPPTVSR